MPELSIIIPTKDRGNIFYKTFQRVVESSLHLDVEILVINNSLSSVVIPEKPNNVFVYDNPGNKNSVFSSRNYGGRIARSPILLFLDDDILVTKESLQYLLVFHSEHKSACLNVNWVYPSDLIGEISKTVFGRYLLKNGFSAMKSLYGNAKWDDSKPFISKSAASFFLCIEKEDFLRIGGYDERHLHEGTDIDISNRLNNNQIEIWIDPLIMVYHNEEDRTAIVNWLERKKRLGEVHGHSKDATYKLHYSFMKRLGFDFIYSIQPFLLKTIKLFNKAGADFIGFFFIDALLGANMCHGYYSAKE